MKQFTPFIMKWGVSARSLSLSVGLPLVFVACMVAVVGAAAGDIRSKNIQIKIRALDELGRHHKAEASAEVRGLLKTEKDESARIHIINCIGRLGDSRAAGDIETLATQDQSKEVQVASCLALGLIHSKSSIKALTDVIRNENEEADVRISAGSSLTFYIMESGVQETLEDILRSADRDVRFGVVNSLRNIKRIKAGKELINIALQDSDEDIRALAVELNGKN